VAMFTFDRGHDGSDRRHDDLDRGHDGGNRGFGVSRRPRRGEKMWSGAFAVVAAESVGTVAPTMNVRAGVIMSSRRPHLTSTTHF
jgi:hypothetical protein